MSQRFEVYLFVFIIQITSYVIYQQRQDCAREFSIKMNWKSMSHRDESRCDTHLKSHIQHVIGEMNIKHNAQFVNNCQFGRMDDTKKTHRGQPNCVNLYLLNVQSCCSIFLLPNTFRLWFFYSLCVGISKNARWVSTTTQHTRYLGQQIIKSINDWQHMDRGTINQCML